MSAQIPNYDEFAKLPLAQRKMILGMAARFGGSQLAPLFMAVYQHDPDPELRALAIKELGEAGISVQGDGRPLNTSTPPAQPSSALGGIGISGFGSGDALSQQEDALRRQFAADARADQQAELEGEGVSVSVGPTFVWSNTMGSAAPVELTGGTGRPVQRGPQLANVFTLRRGDEKYLTGERNTLRSGNGVILLVVVILVAALGFTLFMFNATGFTDMQMPFFDTSGLTNLPVLIIGGVFGLIFLILFLVMVFGARRRRFYLNNGQLLLGQVVAAWGRWHTSTDSEGGTSRSYRVTLKYRVRAPDGLVIEDEASETRNDLARSVLPNPGDPIALLYVDKDHIRVV
ncbi:MAG: hypothetical protein IPM16_16295 [Chloroflexi bacterium]|nr:hypothetical protein [Chloroflexota bacterium]